MASILRKPGAPGQFIPLQPSGPRGPLQFTGTSFDWLHPFPVLTGIGLVLGYALLGAGWIVMKTEGDLRDWAHVRMPRLLADVASPSRRR